VPCAGRSDEPADHGGSGERRHDVKQSDNEPLRACHDDDSRGRMFPGALVRANDA